MRQVAIPSVLPGQLPPRPPATHTRRYLGGDTMGTTWRVDAFVEPHCSNDELHSRLSEELERLVAQLSHWRDDSDLNRFNRSPAETWVELPDSLCTVLEAALHVSDQSGGAFDVSVGPVVDMWGFGPSQKSVQSPPPDSDIESPNQSRNAGRICLDAVRRRALQPGGVSLDLSSIAKGYAVDRIAALLNVPEVSSCLVEIGGELRARGVKSDGQPWWVMVEPPPDMPSFPDTVVALSGLSIATSGDYRHFFEHGGARYSHTVDPRTGRPVQNAIASVTVIHEQCMLADAYSTAILVMGADEGIAFADQLQLAALIAVRGEIGCRASRVFRLMLVDAAEMNDSL